MSSEIVADEKGVIVFPGPESCIVCFVVQPRRVSVVPKIYPDGWMDGWTRYYNYTPSLFFFFFPAKFLAPICKREKRINILKRISINSKVYITQQES
jgi:hypothetical protein